MGLNSGKRIWKKHAPFNNKKSLKYIDLNATENKFKETATVGTFVIRKPNIAHTHSIGCYLCFKLTGDENSNDIYRSSSVC